MTGCNQRCPCRLWVNCDYYVDEHERQRRVKEKYNNSSIQLWYETYFRHDWSMSDIAINV